MSRPTSENRLSETESPYLQEHADNPIHWQPWDDQARKAAAAHDVPIFLSIGYSSCHWCHVMKEESFEDDEIAAHLNEHFVPIKVDREERPDLDSIYMSICQRVTGQGGWPLSVFLTPETEPFYVGTYFPKEPRRGQPGFRQLLEQIHKSWTDPEQRAELEARATKWVHVIEDDLEEVPEQPGEISDDFLAMAADSAVTTADRRDGGWGRAQKFPQTSRLDLLLRAAATLDGDDYQSVAEETLSAMANGGLYDHVGGGFHRYTTDREWTVPHFEKMLYDNAEIPRVMLAGFQLTGRDRYADVAAETFRFLERELQHPKGGLYSALDARSEGAEGTFYVWQPEEIQATVEDDHDATLFQTRYGVTARGNFDGATVPTRAASIKSLAADYEMDRTEVTRRLERARRQVFEARTARTRPARDEKVLAGWNGLAVSALAEGALVLDESWADTARDVLSFVSSNHWDGTRLHRRFKDGNVDVPGYLADYAFLGQGALDLYGITGEVEHLAFALDLARGIEREFWAPESGTLYFTPESGESLVARPQEVSDQSTPSSTGAAAELLLSLAHFVPHDRFTTIAEKVIETHARNIESAPFEHAGLTLAADQLVRGGNELTLTVRADWPDTWRDILAGTYIPRRLLAPRPADPDTLDDWLQQLDIAEIPPIWADRDAVDDQATIYACRSRTCSPPKHDLEAVLDWMAAT